MLFKTSAVTVLAVAAQAAAEPQPYKAGNKMMMSVRDMFGVVARADSSGYSPSQSFCGLGTTCAEACGSGFQTCASNDNAIHCYNPTASQICCPDNSGNSCDAGYYCTGATNGDTVCCPNSDSLEQCASAYGVTGSLTKEVASSTSTSSSSTSTSAPVTTTSSSSSSSSTSSVVATTNSTTTSATSSKKYAVANSTTVLATGTGHRTTTTSCTGTVLTSAATAATVGSNLTVTSATATATPTEVAISGADFVKPVSALVALVAAAFALL